MREEILNLWDFMITLEGMLEQAKREIKEIAYIAHVTIPNEEEVKTK